jgi:hypothetical protein
MSRAFQVTIDSSDPRALGGFWAEVLGYVEDAPPPGFATWTEALTAWGLPPERHNDAYAVVDPDGAGPRVFLQKVPEGKTAKNRLHLDVRVSGVPVLPRARASSCSQRPTDSSPSAPRWCARRSRRWTTTSSCRTPRATSSA